MIRLHAASKTWDGGRSWAVRRADLHIPEGAFVALVGESGSGKTTCLKLMNRLVDPTQGRVEVDGQDLQQVDAVALRRRMGWVLQEIGLFPHWTVARNIATVPTLLGWPAERVRDRVDPLLDLVGLDPDTYRDRRPDQLSGGQQQRVGVARALAAEPPILLMDEPFGALDPVTRDGLQHDVRHLHERLGLTTVLVTHDMAEALTLADLVVVLREGRIVGQGAPGDLLRDPGDPYVQALLQTPLRHAQALRTLQEG